MPTPNPDFRHLVMAIKDRMIDIYLAARSDDLAEAKRQARDLQEQIHSLIGALEEEQTRRQTAAEEARAALESIRSRTTA